MGKCTKCGSETRGGICTYCEEELYIYTYQYDDMKKPITDEFMQKVDEQENTHDATYRKEV